MTVFFEGYFKPVCRMFLKPAYKQTQTFQINNNSFNKLYNTNNEATLHPRDGNRKPTT